MTRIAREGAGSGSTRLVSADWLADRARPEWYVVRHDEPQLWAILRTVDAGPDGRDAATECRRPWLPVTVRAGGWVTDPQLFAALLVANGARSGPASAPGMGPHPVDR